MELRLKRNHFADLFTIGELTIDGLPNKWSVMEDTDRGLTQEMLLPEVSRLKQFGKTAIPYGRYEVVVNRSTRFKVDLPQLLKVKEFGGVRMHVGNFPTDTEGCLLIGKGCDVSKGMITSSKIGFGEVFELIEKAFKNNQKIFITITKNV